MVTICSFIISRQKALGSRYNERFRFTARKNVKTWFKNNLIRLVQKPRLIFTIWEIKLVRFIFHMLFRLIWWFTFSMLISRENLENERKYYVKVTIINHKWNCGWKVLDKILFSPKTEIWRLRSLEKASPWQLFHKT